MKRHTRSRLGVCAVVFAAALPSAGRPGMGSGMKSSAEDGPATHNMLIVGERTVYLSHLPMFQQEGKPPMPHRYQVILEVTFENQTEYVEDRGARPSTIYMMNPERFVLPSLVSEADGLRSFGARAIFRGHLEREGAVPIIRDSRVTLQRVIHFREFEPAKERPEELEYLLFGRGEELFLAHLIAAPPDFDQVLSVKLAGGTTFDDEELANGISVLFPKTNNTAEGRLKAKQRVMGVVQSGTSPSAGPMEIELEVATELYFEEGELKIPAVFETTPEEKRAGFP